MKGIVEVYGVRDDGSRHLLIKEENMSTIGFAEQVVDILTTPSAVENPTSLASSIIDTSNYTIQAVSFSKEADQFRKNAHTFDTSNLLYWTRLDSSDTIADFGSESSSIGWSNNNLTLEYDSVLGPVAGVSGIRLLKESTTALSELTYTLYLSSTHNYGNTNYPAFNGLATDVFFSATDFVFSFDVKYDQENPPDKAYGSAGYRISEFSVTVDGTTSPASSLVLAWDSSGNADIVPHLDTTNFTDSGSIKKIGGGWYRAFIKGKTDAISDPSFIKISMCPSFLDFDNSGTVSPGNDRRTSRGGVFIARPQLEIGSVPTQYVENNTSSNVLDDFLRFSVLNRTGSVFSNTGHGVGNRSFIVSSESGLSMSGLYDLPEGDKGVSAYTGAKSELPKYPHPLDRKLTENITTPVEDALGYTLHNGHNIVSTAFQDYKLSSLDSNWQAVSGSTGVDFELGRHALLLGGWPNQNGQWTYLAEERTDSSFSDAVTNSSHSSNEQQGFYGAGNTLGDAKGYLQAADNAINNPSYSKAAARHAFWVSSTSDFSSTGEVDYTIGLAGINGLIISNSFGGFNTIGLHGIDLKQTRNDSSGSYPPYSYTGDRNTSPSYKEPTRRYKLMCKKVFTDNILRKDGDTGNIGLDSYSDIYIRWRLKFL